MTWLIYDTSKREFVARFDQMPDTRKMYICWTPDRKTAMHYRNCSIARRTAARINLYNGTSTCRSVDERWAEVIQAGNEYGKRKETSTWKML